MPSCSIIVPFYNAQGYLEQCVESILRQSFTDYEILLINDGSTDDSLAISQSFVLSNRRIKLYSQENLGVSVARMVGVKESSADWIMFVDADDYLYPNALSILMSQTQGVDIVNASLCSSNGKKMIHSKLGVLTQEEYIKSLLDSSSYGFPVAKLFRKNLISVEDFHFPRNIKVGEDVLMNLKIATKVSSVINISDIIYCYQQNYSSTMNSYSRSVLYFLRYFNIRDAFLQNDYQKYSLPYDVRLIVNAFFDDNIPYKSSYYNAAHSYLQKIDISIVRDSNTLRKINLLLKSKFVILIVKAYYYYRQRACNSNYKARIILD